MSAAMAIARLHRWIRTALLVLQGTSQGLSEACPSFSRQRGQSCRWPNSLLCMLHEILELGYHASWRRDGQLWP